jgi:di/tricarboxylate transporter
MTGDQITLFAIFAGVFALFAWGRLRYDLVAFSALILGVVLGAVPADRAFSGFGHPATFMVALVLIASAGLSRSGAVALITRNLIRSDRSTTGHIVTLGGLGAVMSGFMNNIAALALLMPVDRQVARKAGRAAALTLMPLSFATILGGMVTLIGTPPNIIVASFRGDALGTPFRMFDFAPVGLLVAAAGLAWVALVGWRLIPVRTAQKSAEEEFADYVAELVVPKDAKLIGQRISELEPAADDADVAILSLIRGGKRRHGSVRNATLAAEDVLLIEGSPDALEEFRSALKLAFPKSSGDSDEDDSSPSPAGGGQVLIEAVARHGRGSPGAPHRRSGWAGARVRS